MLIRCTLLVAKSLLTLPLRPRLCNIPSNGEQTSSCIAVRPSSNSRVFALDSQTTQVRSTSVDTQICSAAFSSCPPWRNGRRYVSSQPCGPAHPNGQQLAHIRTFLGNMMGSFESWLLLRSLRTLHLRVPRQSENSTGLAQWLAKAAGVSVSNSHPSRSASDAWLVSGQSSRRHSRWSG